MISLLNSDSPSTSSLSNNSCRVMTSSQMNLATDLASAFLNALASGYPEKSSLTITSFKNLSLFGILTTSIANLANNRLALVGYKVSFRRALERC
jgi:hypothetical protein